MNKMAEKEKKDKDVKFDFRFKTPNISEIQKKFDKCPPIEKIQKENSE
jgi:S-ribosylhomocysteine lyase LuxS involved in autoinducer biosynthesis